MAAAAVVASLAVAEAVAAAALSFIYIELTPEN
jgi:hypothetical protein